MAVFSQPLKACMRDPRPAKVTVHDARFHSTSCINYTIVQWSIILPTDPGPTCTCQALAFPSCTQLTVVMHTVGHLQLDGPCHFCMQPIISYLSVSLDLAAGTSSG